MAQDSNAKAVASLADKLALASSALLQYRIDNKKRMKLDQRIQLEDDETTLDQLVAILRGAATRLLAKDAAEPLAQLELQIDRANATIAKIEQVKKALGIAAALVNVTAALVGGDAKALVSAMQNLRKATDDADKDIKKTA